MVSAHRIGGIGHSLTEGSIDKRSGTVSRKDHNSVNRDFQTMNLSQPSPNLRQWSQNVCKRLGLDPDFIHSLMDEDDWSFVIKANALLEAALTHALVKKLGGVQKLRSLVQMLGQSRRIGLAVELGLLGKNEQRFMVMLNGLRNTVVHDVTNVDLDLVKYFKELDDGKQTSFISSCSFHLGPDVTQDLIAKLWLKSPKLMLWIPLHFAIAPLYDFLPSKVDVSVTPPTADLVIHAYPPTVSTSPPPESDDK